jgi:WXG100 family type VII secretion target
MAANDKIVDEATTVAMIKAFDLCQQECTSIKAKVTGAHEQLLATWGGAAAQKYDAAMHDWYAGYNDVVQGLNQLNESMVQWAQITTTTEDNAIVQGSGWANVR